MRPLTSALWSESLKIVRSRVFWFSQLFFVFVTMMMGLIMFIQGHPEIAGKLGIIGTKASLFQAGPPVWNSFFILLLQAEAAIGMIGFGFVASWVFGREYSDKTVKDILALPVSRNVIVGAKFIVSGVWCLLLSIVFFAFAILSGWLSGMHGWSQDVLTGFLKSFTSISLMTILLITPVAFFASTGRGYLLPFAFIILTVMMANFTGLLGLGPWFPWSIPGMLSIPQNGYPVLGIMSYLILFFTSLAGYLSTLLWWHYADQR